MARGRSCTPQGRGRALLAKSRPAVRVVRIRPLVFKREAGSEIRRYFAGPFLPGFLLRPSLIPVVPSPCAPPCLPRRRRGLPARRTPTCRRLQHRRRPGARRRPARPRAGCPSDPRPYRTAPQRRPDLAAPCAHARWVDPPGRADHEHRAGGRTRLAAATRGRALLDLLAGTARARRRPPPRPSAGGPLRSREILRAAPGRGGPAEGDRALEPGRPLHDYPHTLGESSATPQGRPRLCRTRARPPARASFWPSGSREVPKRSAFLWGRWLRVGGAAQQLRDGVARCAVARSDVDARRRSWTSWAARRLRPSRRGGHPRGRLPPPAARLELRFSTADPARDRRDHRLLADARLPPLRRALTHLERRPPESRRSPRRSPPSRCSTVDVDVGPRSPGRDPARPGLQLGARVVPSRPPGDGGVDVPASSRGSARVPGTASAGGRRSPARRHGREARIRPARTSSRGGTRSSAGRRAARPAPPRGARRRAGSSVAAARRRGPAFPTPPGARSARSSASPPRRCHAGA